MSTKGGYPMVVHIPAAAKLLTWEKQVVVAHAPLPLFERPAWASEDQVPVNTNKSVQVPYSENCNCIDATMINFGA